MRISDWSSDVCSSDLLLILIQMRLQAARFQAIEIGQPGWNVLLHLRFGRTVNFSAITGGKNGGLFDRRTKGGAQAIESGLEDVERKRHALAHRNWGRGGMEPES